jgi:hypothetical protein
VERFLEGRPDEERRDLDTELSSVAIVRLLQALGAFAYLGHRLGKPGFLPHAKLALERLHVLTEKNYPCLAELSRRLTPLLP